MLDREEREERKGYYYLWHLVSMGVITPDEDGENFSDTLWDKLAAKECIQSSTVVLIDVGCSFAHPNLAGRVDAKESIDFTVSPYGAKLSATGANANMRHFENLNLEGLKVDWECDKDRSFFEEVIDHIKASDGDMRTYGEVEANFASHGTAVSGLIVGGPELCGDHELPPSSGVIPYFGVDPYSRLISVRTGFDNDPLQFASALLYAWHKDADVIVMPRGMPNPIASAMQPKDDFKAELESWANQEPADLLERIEALQKHGSEHNPGTPQDSITKKRLWRLVDQLFVAISKQIPIVCAAGNDGESQLNYPANLANRENGIIAVGALSGNGFRSGYSNYGDGLTLVAPSDDLEIFNRHQLRETETREKILEYLSPKTAQRVRYSDQALLSTDIPGAFGYDASGLSVGDHEDPEAFALSRGLYTQFGGTSGASALVGGVIALIRRAERGNKNSAPLRDGCEIKELLRGTARKTMPTMKDTLPIETDSMNSDGEEAEPFKVFFGDGLVDAEAAVRDAMSGK